MGSASFTRAQFLTFGFFVAAATLAGCAKGGGTSGSGGVGGAAQTASGTGGALTGATSTTGTGTGTTTGTTTATATATGTGGAGTGTGSGSSTSTGMMGLPLGDPCTVDSDCASMLCKPVVLDSPSVCVTPCTQQSDCGTSPNYFCEPITAGSTSGYCIPHSPAHCLSCTQNSDCGSLSEECFLAPGDNEKACHIDCSLSGAAGCPNDYNCVAETINGQPRQVCRPKLIPTCLDAIGGFCDRLTVPQDCIRTNAAGLCIGQRPCLATTKRFDKCGATAPQYKPDCSSLDPAGCMESFASAATSGPTNCGMCGNICPGYQQSNDNVTCDATQMCTFSCQGEHYDVDGNPANGCEVADSPTGNHVMDKTVDASLGDISCNDGNGHTVHYTGLLPSDMRVHENASITGFDAATGSAPDWVYIHATGGVCVNDVVLTLSLSGTNSPSCYTMYVKTDKNAYSCSGNCSINHGSGQYSDGSDMFIEVYKTCGGNESPSYTVDGHL